VQHAVGLCEHHAGPVRDGWRMPVDVGGDQVDVDQQQLLELTKK
jgi:hypothetical protein